MNQLTQRQKLQRVVSVIVIVSGLLVLVLLVMNSNNQKNGQQTEYFDENSGETVSHISGKTPESDGTSSSKPLYLGFGVMSENGFTQDDMATVKSAYEAYFAKSHQKVAEVSIVVDSFTAGEIDSQTSNSITSFNVVFNRKDKYVTKLETSGLSDLTVRLYDSSGKLVSTYPG